MKIFIFMLSLLFGQTDLQIKEFEIENLDSQIYLINYVSTIDGYYTIKLIQIENFTFETTGFYEGGCTINGFNGEIKISIWCNQGDLEGCDYSIDNKALIVTSDSETLDIGCTNNQIFTGNSIFRIIGKFSDSTNLEGDINDDDSVNILDIVVLVNIILTDGEGVINDLIDIMIG